MTRIQLLKYEFGFENQSNKSFYRLRETVYIIKEMTRHYYNRIICSIKGHDIECEYNEVADVENGPSEKDVNFYCTRCSY